MDHPRSRREALREIATAGLGVLSLACGSSGGSASRQAASCDPTPPQIAGPFFADVGLERSDIREGRAGVPLALDLQVVEAGDGCTPIPDATVELWHADASGAYSAFDVADGNPSDQGDETFLRGAQPTDADGRVGFATIYPGWYPGRTVHIHARVVVGSVERLTTQLYFPDALTDRVMAEPAYAARGPRSTSNATDLLAVAIGSGLDALRLEVTPAGAGYAAAHVLAV